MWKKIEKMNLQLFADGGDEGGDEGNGGEEKTFTQSEVNALLAREKKQGKNSVLRALGIKDVDEGLQKMNANSNKEKSAEEKAAELIDSANRGKADAENRAVAAERKLAAMKAGVKSEFVEDVVFIAGAKVTDDNDFDSVIEGLKKTHTFYFEGEKQKDGTGSNSNYRKSSKEEPISSYGKKLAEQKTKSAVKQTDFFS